METAINEENVPLAFLLATLAGLSTTIGAALVFSKHIFDQLNNEILGAALGFSAGVMLYISLTEILSESIDAFGSCNCLWEKDENDEAPAYILGTLCFFSGVILTYFLDFIVHFTLKYSFNGKAFTEINLKDMKNIFDKSKAKDEEEEEEEKQKMNKKLVDENKDLNEFSIKDEKEPEVEKEEVNTNETIYKEDKTDKEKLRLKRMGLLTALALGIHNLPDGIATFAVTVVDPRLGASLAVAIAVHNIPEGLCVAVPIYYATGSRLKGFLVAFFSGLTEVFGAFLGYLFLRTTIGPISLGIIFGVVGGMMVTIVMKELLPTAFQFDPTNKYVTKSIFIGFAVMSLSLTLFLL